MNWKTKALLSGGAIGLLIGLVTAWLYVRSADVIEDRKGHVQLPPVGSADLVRIGISVASVVRTIVGLASSKD
jgi:ABC-type Mn2+/Zn2+ transport system permease subunit